LHHVEEELRHFVQRDLIDVLQASKAWGLTATVAAGEIHLATNCIRIELYCPGLASQSARIDFANRGGLLMASIAHLGWLGELSEGQREAFEDALAGWYKQAGVDLVREHLKRVLPPGSTYDVIQDGLVVWLDAERTQGAKYDLRLLEQAPQRIGPSGTVGLPANARSYLFSESPIAWSAWVEQWERDQAGKEHHPRLLPEVRLLPGGG
jgi:hypothetical protein